MRTKEIITAKQIELDVINSYKQKEDMPEVAHKKIIIPSAIAGCILGFIGVLFPWTAMWCISAIVIGVVIYFIVSSLLFHRKKSRFCIDDYQVKTIKLLYNTQERYIDRSGRSHRTVNIYVLHFEDGRAWTVPNKNYRWSKEMSMSENAILQSPNVGDDFVAVAEKATGNIVVAYNTKFFEYKAVR